MGGTGLQCLAVVHECLDGIGGFGTGELVGLGLLAADDRDGKILLVEVRVDVQHALGLFDGFLCRGVQGMALLPQEFTGTQERTGGLLPAHDADPLVIEFRQVAVGLDDVLPVVAEQGLGCRTDAQALFELLTAADGDPGALGREAFDVVLLFVEEALRNEHRHVDVLVSGLLEITVKNALDVFPDGIAVRTDDHTALDARVADEFCFLADVGIPFGKIDIHGSDVFHHLFLLRHEKFSFKMIRDSFAILYSILPRSSSKKDPRGIPAGRNGSKASGQSTRFSM